MNGFSQALIVALLVSNTGLVSCNAQPKSSSNPQPSAHAPTADAIQLKLPPLAEVQMKEDKSKSGQVTAIDSQKQQLKIELDGTSEWVGIDQIERVTFNQESLPIGNDPIIRGEDEIWSVKPLSEFQIDPSIGRAEVKRKIVPELQQSTGSVSPQAISYMVRAMWFIKEPSGTTMRLKVVAEQ